MRVSAVSGLLAATLVFFGAVQAFATGTVIVQQHNGSVQTYPNATIRVENKALKITSADKKGTLIIDRAACSYVGELLRCLPYSMKLDQGGGLHRLDFQRGTVYLNLTDDSQELPLSSKRLPPQSIMLSLTTKVGTIVNITGGIDK